MVPLEALFSILFTGSSLAVPKVEKGVANPFEKTGEGCLAKAKVGPSSKNRETDA